MKRKRISSGRARSWRRTLRFEDLEGRALMAVDLDDSLSEATPLAVVSPTPQSVSGRIDPDIDVDMYRFTVTPGQVVDFDIDTPFNGPGGLGSYVRLFDSAGQLLAFNDDGTAPGENQLGFDAYLRHTFTSGGTFFLGISNWMNASYNPTTGNGDTSGGQHTVGDFQLTVQSLPNDTDDSQAEAVSLGPISTTPQVVSASINPDVDVDLYRFTITAGQVIDFDIDTPLNGPGGLGSFLRLFDSAGQQIAFNDDGTAPGENQIGFDAYLRHTFTSGGTFFLGISNLNNASYDPTTGNGDTAGGPHAIGDYQLTVQALPNDTDDSQAEAVSLGPISTTPDIVSARIDPDIDVDLYRFTVNPGQVVDFDIDTPLNGPGGLGSFLRLFDATGQLVAFNNDGAAPGETELGFDAYLRHAFTRGGTYFIGVSNFTNGSYDPTTGNGDVAGGQHSIGDYQLTVNTAPAAAADAADAVFMELGSQTGRERLRRSLGI
jgi:hypothetical protein